MSRVGYGVILIFVLCLGFIIGQLSAPESVKLVNVPVYTITPCPPCPGVTPSPKPVIKPPPKPVKKKPPYETYEKYRPMRDNVQAP